MVPAASGGSKFTHAAPALCDCTGSASGEVGVGRSEHAAAAIVRGNRIERV